uniref:RYYR-CCHC domain-containing protein n=1 Tax=Plectus sambesii TaxID=2011161 RepID=A0A914VSZ6_9BILA
MALNWNDENVMRALEDYKEKKIANLAELQTIVHDLTGVLVSRMTLSRRVRGERMYNAVGRPPARLQNRNANLTASPNGWGAFAQSSSSSAAAANSPPSPSSNPTNDDTPPILQSSSTRPKRNAAKKYRVSRASPASASAPYTPARTPTTKRSKETEWIVVEPTMEEALSKRLSNNILTVPIGDGFVRQYCLTKQNHDGSVKYYRCSRCEGLHRKLNTGIHPKLQVRNGLISVQQVHQPHHPDCHPIKEVKALAMEIDRRCRKEVREGRFAPREIYEMGFDEVLKLSEVVDSPRSSESLLAMFPGWNAVRSQFYRLRKLKKNEDTPESLLNTIGAADEAEDVELEGAEQAFEEVPLLEQEQQQEEGDKSLPTQMIDPELAISR